MTDRDMFAAAALTGLLSNVQRYQNEPLTRQAYEIADFMLRERGRAVSHNCVTSNHREMECPVAEPLPKEKRAEVSFTLTDEEREAIHQSAIDDDVMHHHTRAATLRKLLERLGGGQ